MRFILFQYSKYKNPVKRGEARLWYSIWEAFKTFSKGVKYQDCLKFPDQSTINRFLNRFETEGTLDLETTFDLILQSFFFKVAFSAFNLLSTILFREKVLAGTGLEDLGVVELIEKLMDIPGKIEQEKKEVNLLIKMISCKSLLSKCPKK